LFVPVAMQTAAVFLITFSIHLKWGGKRSMITRNVLY